MSTVATSAPARKVSRPRVLLPVTVTLSGDYDRETGLGCVNLNGKRYVLEAVRDASGRTLGLSFGPLDGTDTTHHVDFTDPFGWRCDCPDATYNHARPGGCKHVGACRQLAAQLRG